MRRYLESERSSRILTCRHYPVAALALCHKMNWKRHNLVRGHEKRGNVYVFMADDALVAVE